MNQINKNPKKEFKSNSVNFILLTAALVTLIFKTDFYDPFNSPKLMLLLLMDCWVIGQLAYLYRNQSTTLARLEKIVISILLIFILSLLVSTLFTDNFISGLIGETQRRNGFLSYLGLALIFLLASKSLTFSNVTKVYKAGILTGSLLSTYGVIQISGHDFVAWDNPYSAMISTLGNPNFASALLAVLVLLGTYSIQVKSISVRFKFLSVYLILTALFAIAISGSRQGLLVIFFSLLFYISAYSFSRNIRLGLLMSLTSGALGIVAAFGMLQKGPLSALLYKDSISVRGYYWRAGIEMFQHSPLTGVGVDRYGDFFRLFREVGYPLKYGFEISSSNAHNTFIQLFATAGLFVGISYLVLICSIFYAGISLLKEHKSEEFRIVLGLLSAWVGFQAQSLISIDNIGISIWGWLLGGSLLGLKFNKVRESNLSTRIDNQNRRSNKIKINLLQPMVSFFVLVPTLILVSSIYKVENSLFILKGIANPAYPQNKSSVLQYCNSVISSPVADPIYKYRCAYFLFDMGYQEESHKVFSDLILKYPNNPDLMRGKILIEGTRNDAKGVIEARERLAVLDPWNADNYLNLIKLYKATNDRNKMNSTSDKLFKFAQGTEIAASVLEILD